MNVYFGLEADCRTERWLRAIVDVTGGSPADPAAHRQMLASLAVSAGVGTTFFWDRPDTGRWTLYALNVPCDDPTASAALPRCRVLVDMPRLFTHTLPGGARPRLVTSGLPPHPPRRAATLSPEGGGGARRSALVVNRPPV